MLFIPFVSPFLFFFLLFPSTGISFVDCARERTPPWVQRIALRFIWFAQADRCMFLRRSWWNWGGVGGRGNQGYRCMRVWEIGYYWESNCSFFFSFPIYFILFFFFSYRTMNPSVRVSKYRLPYFSESSLASTQAVLLCYPTILHPEVRRVESSRVQVRSGLRPASDPKSYFCRQLHPSRNPRACLRSQSG